MARRPAARARPAPETTYQRRIRLYKERHPGATTQEARGKPRKEHVVRRERELRETGLTNYERGVVRKIAYRQAGRMNQTETRVDPDEVNRRLQLWAREKGFARVQELRDKIKSLEKTKRHRVRVRRKIGGRVIRVEISGASSNVGGMQSAFADFDLPDLPDDLPEWFWFFYH